MAELARVSTTQLGPGPKRHSNPGKFTSSSGGKDWPAKALARTTATPAYGR